MVYRDGTLARSSLEVEIERQPPAGSRAGR
jgi:hypothetical protein